MKRNVKFQTAFALFYSIAGVWAQSPDLEIRLQNSLQELARLRKTIAEEKLPMAKRLNSLESELIDVRLEYRAATRQLDSRKLDLNNLRTEIETRRNEQGYITDLLSEYIRNMESRLHIAELQRYGETIEAARLAPENSALSVEDIHRKQTALAEASMVRLQEHIGGAVFAGKAADEEGLLRQGQYVLLGPTALFSAKDGSLAGIAEQRLGSLEPMVMPFTDPGYTHMIRGMVTQGTGKFPFDPSLGNARKIEETRETLGEHLQKGGFVVWPIVGMFCAVVLVAAVKLTQLTRIPMPSETQIEPVLDAMLSNEHSAAAAAIGRLEGPVGAMLSLGIEHISEPKELVEEVMYEKLLTTRMSVTKWSSLIAFCASSAPLMGLLGTVTGIIKTFKLITIFGSGDVKTLSGGISEALITTELGLVVAICSLLLYAFLSRKAKSITDRMEQIAILFMNRATRSIPSAGGFAEPEETLLKA